MQQSQRRKMERNMYRHTFSSAAVHAPPEGIVTLGKAMYPFVAPIFGAHTLTVAWPVGILVGIGTEEIIAGLRREVVQKEGLEKAGRMKKVEGYST